MIETDRFAKVEVASRDELRDWLAANHRQEASVWLVTWKRSVPAKYLSRWVVLDELLCFGWIDGIRRKLDADRTMQLISPRQQQVWTKTYKDRVARLERQGMMTDSGRKAVARSKRLGLWNASADIDALLVPDDLRAALDARPLAGEWFDAAAPSYRRNVLRWIKGAVRPETRATRIGELVERSGRGEKVPQM
ncbi:MAG: hypothetical protein DI547_16805 [Sphingobium sp.]|nr:MAG: hypothetical protein DI547_16805 [Sphingobium sp.]